MTRPLTPHLFARLRTLRVLFLALLVSTTALAETASGSPSPSSAPPCVAPEAPKSRNHDAATKHDAAFNRDFRHCFTTVRGVQMHYVIGGTGPQTTVLLHGWPESWFEYREVMPRLLPGRTVIAIDLPGMGDSTGRPAAYTKSVLAGYVHDLLVRIGAQRDVRVVAHDFGVGVAYALAARHRQQVAGLFLMDFPLVGRNLSFETDVRPLSWHFSFNVQDPLAERLVEGRVGTFLDYFFRHSQISGSPPPGADLPSPVPPRALAEYTRVFSRPQVLHAGFELYRTWSQDEEENKRLQQVPLTIPVRLLTQDGLTGMMLPPVRDAAPSATGTDVDGAGHWLLEERPDRVVAEIDAFYAEQKAH
ncbi:alpha/beta hydrolase [Streptomyces sp. NPDC052309]|uniref:alpha/beta fold hydrolase n=1 Tax=Streptomyces sp. NPDC052309 TaxID=3155421 RepID=UPI0034233855